MNKPVYLGLAKLETSKLVMYEFWYDYVKPKCGGKKQNYITWAQIVLQYTWKQKTITQTLQNILKQDLMLQITN